MIDSYCGESPGKKLARASLYSIVAEQFVHHSPGMFVALAGRGAMEVSMLRDYLGLAPERVMFVDRVEDGLRCAAERWPGVRTFHGDLDEAIASLRGPLRFVHADFMGLMSEKVAVSATRIFERLEKEGLFSLTYLRGRDKEGLLFGNETRHMPQPWRRNFAASMCIEAGKDEPQGVMVNHLHYKSVVSPMGAVTFVKRKPKVSLVEAILRRQWGEVTDTEVDLKRVLGHSKDSPERTAALFGVERATVLACKAHATRGTYAARAVPGWSTSVICKTAKWKTVWPGSEHRIDGFDLKMHEFIVDRGVLPAQDDPIWDDVRRQVVGLAGTGTRVSGQQKQRKSFTERLHGRMAASRAAR